MFCASWVYCSKQIPIYCVFFFSNAYVFDFVAYIEPFVPRPTRLTGPLMHCQCLSLCTSVCQNLMELGFKLHDFNKMFDCNNFEHAATYKTHFMDHILVRACVWIYVYNYCKYEMTFLNSPLECI